MELLALSARLGVDPAHTPIVLTYPHPHSDFAIFTGTLKVMQGGIPPISEISTRFLFSNCSRRQADGSIPLWRGWMYGLFLSPCKKAADWKDRQGNHSSPSTQNLHLFSKNSSPTSVWATTPNCPKTTGTNATRRRTSASTN